MNSKTIIGSLLGFAGLFGSGYILYMYVLGGILMVPEDPDFMYIILGEIVFGYLIATTLSASGAKNPADGAKAAALLGFVIALAAGLIDVGAEAGDLMNNIIDAVVWGVRWGIGGAIVGWWLGKD